MALGVFMLINHFFKKKFRREIKRDFPNHKIAKFVYTGLNFIIDTIKFKISFMGLLGSYLGVTIYCFVHIISININYPI